MIYQDEIPYWVNDKVIITDIVDNKKVYLIDTIQQVIVSKEYVEYIFEKVSRPVRLSSKRIYPYEEESSLISDGYEEVVSLI